MSHMGIRRFCAPNFDDWDKPIEKVFMGGHFYNDLFQGHYTVIQVFGKYLQYGHAAFMAFMLAEYDVRHAAKPYTFPRHYYVNIIRAFQYKAENALGITDPTGAESDAYFGAAGAAGGGV